MAKTWHWYCVNGTGGISADGTQNGSDVNHYAWWFDDNGTGSRTANHSSNAGGVLPAAGDAIVFDGGTISLNGNTTWTGITFSGAVSVTAPSGTLTLASSCVMNAGASIVNADKAIDLDSRAQWLGDVAVSGFDIVSLTPGWSVRGGNAGGSISITGTGLAIYLYAPAAGQVNTYHDITLALVAGGYTIDIHAMPAMSITGSLVHLNESLWAPPANPVTLAANGAKYAEATARVIGGGIIHL
jgi:hypothetical protein